MIPEKNCYTVKIPITFDVNSKKAGLPNDRFILALVCFGIWLVTVIISFFVDTEILSKLLYIVISFIAMSLIVRYLLLKESYFKSRRNELVEKNYEYPYSQFWNIYDISTAYPYICRFANNIKAVFVRFDKDVIVGREKDNEYYHYEAISDAYLQMHKRGIECMHIDYMDTVGKDDRIAGLFKMAGEAENPELSEVLTRMFDNVEYIMEHSYSSYDVYCFYFTGKDELFLDELDVVIDSFLEANYIKYKFLDRDEINELVKSIFNLSTFSVNNACDKLFIDLGGTHYLTPIWVERNNERKILEKTREEKAAEQNVRTEEKNLRKNKRRKSSYEKKMSKMEARKEVDIWGEDNSGSQNQNNPYDMPQNMNNGQNMYPIQNMQDTNSADMLFNSNDNDNMYPQSPSMPVQNEESLTRKHTTYNDDDEIDF